MEDSSVAIVNKIDQILPLGIFNTCNEVYRFTSRACRMDWSDGPLSYRTQYCSYGDVYVAGLFLGWNFHDHTDPSGS
ncbi:MAG: hypothetical protein ACI8VW_001711 [bacterium]|jgi:hypothetical protein